MKFQDLVNRFEKRTKTSTGYVVRCPAHEDKTPSLSISQGKDGRILVNCFAGCTTESICGSLGITVKDLFPEELKPAEPWRPARGNGKAPPPPPRSDPPDEKYVIEKIYSYTDPLGRELYQAVRLKPKSFRQRHADGKGGWIWNMEGVERVLYRLPDVRTSQTVVVTEGERDVESLMDIGFCATTNVGGANKWLDGYTDSLSGKDVILCGDNDEPGKKHVEMVFDSISLKSKSVRIIKLPASVKDVTEFIATFASKDQAAAALNELINLAVPHMGGTRMPIYSMAEIEPRYAKQVRQSATTMLDLGKWLPSLRRLRPIIPGELVLIIGNTGTGKTALLQNIAMSNRDLRTVMFEMELPEELVFERFLAIEFGQMCREVAENYERKDGEAGPELLQWKFPNLMICPESRLTLDTIESIICRAELKMGGKPVLVLIDYVQLMQARGSRYEKTSDLAEGLKMLAKTTKTIIVVASQVARKPTDDESQEVGLHSGKDSGSLENSAGVVIGAWRDKKDPGLMHMKVLKATKGGAGTTVQCNFDGARMRITERVDVQEEILWARK